MLMLIQPDLLYEESQLKNEVRREKGQYVFKVKHDCVSH